ncbi:MAG TPA: RNA polymerase sigma factor [Longimicrobiales bacterium]|nr:RNA polymerase sigma factor [Longimicrobiales bacterium]
MNGAPALHLAPDVTAAARGDSRAFARLVDATSSTVTSITLAILRDMELSRDVAQEVYLMAWRDLRRLRDPNSFLPWLRQITRNRAHQALRARVRHRRRFESDADALLAAAADPRPDAAQQLVAAEERAALERALAALPPSAREVVVLYYREGQSAAQVAALLDLSETAVRQRLSRARGRLRTILGDVAERSAPGTAFTAAVMAGIASIVAPAAASAAMVGAAGKATTSGGGVTVGGATSGVAAPGWLSSVPGMGGLVGLTGAAAFSALAGLAGGIGALVYGTRDQLRLARDDEERRGVIGVGVVCGVAVLGFIGAMLVRPTPLVATIGFALMMGCFFGAHFVWLPRITARRRAAEAEEDPVAAAAEHRRRRLHARLGFAVGSALGGATIVLAWLL